MSPEEARSGARSEYRSGSFQDLDLRAAHIGKQHIATQHWAEVLDRIDDSADVRSKHNNLAPYARARWVFDTDVDRSYLLRLSENARLIRPDDADAAMTQSQRQRSTNQARANNRDLLNH